MLKILRRLSPLINEAFFQYKLFVSCSFFSLNRNYFSFPTGPATTRRPIPTPAKQREKADVALEIGEYGGGFFVLVLFLLAGIVITNRCYKRQPIIRVPYPNYSTFDAIPQVRVRTIPYGDIKDIKK